MKPTSNQLTLSIVVSLMAMISFVLLSQEAGVQLARDARTNLPLSADYMSLPSLPRFFPISN